MDQNLLAAVSILIGAILAFLLFGGKSSKTAPKQVKTKPEPQAFTRAEVATHNKEGDFWLILKAKGSDELKVYDLSDYADEHPGGDSIYRNAGDDATEGFMGPQHPPTVSSHSSQSVLCAVLGKAPNSMYGLISLFLQVHDLIPEYYIGWIQDE